MIGFLLPRCIKPVHSLKHAINVVRCYSQKQPSSRLLSPLTSCAELNEQMQRADWHTDIRVLDARWDMEVGSNLAMHQKTRIGGSKFFSLDQCRDVASPFHYMLPTATEFEEYVTKLGVSNDHHVVVYDEDEMVGMMSSPRVCWMFRVFGHENVSVLDGGLKKWRSDGYPTQSGAYAKEEFLPTPAAAYKANFQPDIVLDFETIQKNMSSSHPIPVVDTRPVEFLDQAYLTNSISLPVNELINDDGTLRSAEQLVSICTSKGLDLDKDIMISCEIGFTATTLSLALSKAVGKDFPVYDGSLEEVKSRAPHMVTWVQEKPM